jgi:hypothetical protein
MFKLKKYNNYIPIGYNCFTSMLLVNLGIRKNAYPLDWVISNPTMILQYFKTNFDNYFLPSPTSDRNYMNQQFDWFRTNRYSNKNTDSNYNEEITNPAISVHEENKLLFDKRINRLLKLLQTTDKNEPVLFIYTGEYRVNCLRDESFNKKMVLDEDEDLNKLIELKNYIKSNYPNLEFDILIIYINKMNKEFITHKENIIIINVNIPINNDEINRKNITDKVRPIFLIE